MTSFRDFARAAHHAGFCVYRARERFVLQREGHRQVLASSQNLDCIGRTIRDLTAPTAMKLAFEAAARR